MQIHYINLDSQTLRREVLLRNLSRMVPPQVGLQRVRAVTADEVRTQVVPGAIRDVEKACYLSHARALAQSLAHADHALILEDDAHLLPESLPAIEHAMAQLAQRQEAWQILYVQVMPVCPEHMVEMLRIRQACLRQHTQLQPDTRHMVLAGACAYVVQAGAKQALLDALLAQGALDHPVDARYWQLARAGHLQARAVFPLPVSVAAEAQTSQIQSPSKAQASLIWNAWMRLAAQSRDLAQIEADMAELPADDDPAVAARVQAWLAPIAQTHEAQELRIMARMLTCMARPDFVSLFTMSWPDASAPSAPQGAAPAPVPATLVKPTQA